MRLVRTNLTWPEVEPHVRELVDALAERVPAGVGSRGFVRIGRNEFDTVLREGARWAVREGYGTEADLEHTEAHGCFDGADPTAVSEHAIKRGYRQIGTLGSGNLCFAITHRVRFARMEATLTSRPAGVNALSRDSLWKVAAARRARHGYKFAPLPKG